MPFHDCLAGAGPLRNLQMQHQSGAPVSCGRCDGCKQRQKLAEWTSTGADWELRREEWVTIPWWVNGILACVFFFLVAVLGMCVLNFPTVRFVRGGSSAADVIPRTEMPTITGLLGSEVRFPDHAPTYMSESAEVHVPVSDHDWTYPSGLADEVSEEIERFASSLWAEKLGSLAASEAKTTSEETSLEAEQSTSEAKLTDESTCESKAELTSASTYETVSGSPTVVSISNVTKQLRRERTTFALWAGLNRRGV
ncbi:hypothetical protein DL769_005314 [Monosporascus sp. CRB-8-3]|nr:hypothetical protein DL769_005314 [Monosporascus sp. CRB-8-3]